MPTRALAVLTAVLVTLFAVTACGGSGSGGSEDFSKEFASINTSLKTLGDQIGTTLTSAPSQSNAQLASAFSGYASQLQTLQTKLDDTSPPDDLKKDVDTLSEAMAQAAKDMLAIAKAATAGDPAEAKTATGDVRVRQQAAARRASHARQGDRRRGREDDDDAVGRRAVAVAADLRITDPAPR